MKELIKKMNLHTINVEGDFIISEEQLETFAKMYHKEQLALYGVVGRSEQLLAFKEWERDKCKLPWDASPEQIVEQYISQ